MFYVSYNSLPRELWLQISSKLEWPDQAAMARVCKRLNAIFQPVVDANWDQIQKSITFGKEQWLNVPGVLSVSEEPEWTEERKKWLKMRLKSKCPFFNKPDSVQPHRFQNSTVNRTHQTFLVIFFPEMINEEHTDVNFAAKLFSFEKTECRERNPGTVVRNWAGNDPNDEYRTKKASRSYFALVSLDLIPGSRNTDHQTKINLLAARGCRVPTPFEALISQAVMNIGPSQKKRGFYFGWGREDLRTLTATDTSYGRWELVVGAAAFSGLHISIYNGDGDELGVAAVAEVP